MSRYVIAISIDKVQSFLYYVLNAPVQDKQTNSGTLSTIIQSSRMILEQFYEDIGTEGSKEETFANQIDEQLLKSSGNCVFITSLLEAEIVERLKKLFTSYYRKYNGQLLMKYTYFPLERLEHSDPDGGRSSYKLLAIKESKRRLRADACLSEIIEQNKEILFGFKGSVELSPGESSSAIKAKYPAFTKTINDLFDDKEANNENHFRIAIIKGDLDGMGELFKSIKDYELYDAVSNILSNYISVNNLHQLTKNIQQQDREKCRNPLKLYPLYMAGDDVFFAVPVHQLGVGISICKSILQQLNQEVEQVSKKLGHCDTALELSMSIGVDFTFNREPIRYYYERVQRQLDVAKAEKGGLLASEKLGPVHHMKICINNLVLHNYEKSNTIQTVKVPEKASENIANLLTWSSMMNGVERLRQAMSHGFTAHHFLYGLLGKITNQEIRKNNLKYSNALFYHLIPQHLESDNQNLRDTELWLLEAIMGQILRIEIRTQQGKIRVKKTISLNEQHKKRLEGYIRILLLFTDPRFNSATQSYPKRFDAARVKSDLFTKPLKYIYEESLGKMEVKPLRKVFIEACHYTLEPNSTPKKNPRETRVEVYRTLRISNSLFHKIKQRYLYQYRVAGELIAAANSQTKEEVEERTNQSKQEYKAPPGLYFEKELFLKCARNPQLWSADYIDALMIFYKLNDKSIHLKEMINFKALKAKQKQERDRNYSGGRRNDSGKKVPSNKR